jgi:hypothetical protein
MTLRPLTDAALEEILGTVFDRLAEHRLRDLVRAEDVFAMLDEVGVAEQAATVAVRVAQGQRARLLAAAAASSTPLSAWLPEAAKEEIATALAEPAPLPPAIVDELIASEQVRDEVRAMLHDTLTSFVTRAMGSTGEQPASGLRGALGRGAMGFAAAGKSLLGGIGAEVQKQLQERVRDFVDASVSVVQTRIADKLKSAETAKHLGVRRAQTFQRVMARTESEVATWVAGMPHETIERLAPEIARHNLGRPEARVVLQAEIAASITDLSQKTLGEWLDEMGLRDAVRKIVIRGATPVARALWSDPKIAAWIGEHAQG